MSSEEAPSTPQQPQRVAVTPAAPNPVRRMNAPVETVLSVRRVLRFSDPTIQTITEEEAASFGVPPLSPIPENGPAEDASMTEETFGADDATDAQAAQAMRTRQPSGDTRRVAADRRGVRRR